ncbi:cysteine-rich KTR domain-containing protein [Clostridium sp. 19966]|uniref:cysteine-rich KTR domain-containing protein n=1 Tax=Clostridium sp. 19966 TaxID=2768166 RepID=UPI0028DDB32E|nr:cysteine-rich KTR domain-containing protein [Clostridium sp. 19966]MDT8718015.1 cysteine-rich KTR domain-containing protein [Clostridium sp. 19966]
MKQEECILCPNCNNKTRLKIRKHTVIERLPLFCPKCKTGSLINVKQLDISIITEPDARTQS